MVQKNQSELAVKELATPISIIRHNEVCRKLQISSAKLFDMIANGLFPKPFVLVPGGRAVGWLEQDVDKWILSRKEDARVAI